nr:unnamed protein product [uncultured bacterium]
MNIYHLSAQIIGRSNGRSAVAAAAYRSGEKIYEKESDSFKDYSRKESVVYTEILLPQNAPAEYADRATLWNAVQEVEKNKNARFSRELNVALPITENLETHKKIIKEYGQYLADQGMCVDIAIHGLKENPHAHIMLTVRAIGENGEWLPKKRKIYDLDKDGNKIPVIDKKTGIQKKDKEGRKQWKSHTETTADWDQQEKLLEWREKWADVCNRYLEPEHQIDHRSNEERGLDELPTKHLGVAAAAMERRGIATEIGDHNREIKRINAYIRSVNSEAKAIVDMQAKIREEQDEIARKYNATISGIRNFEAELSAIFGEGQKAEGGEGQSGSGKTEADGREGKSDTRTDGILSKDRELEFCRLTAAKSAAERAERERKEREARAAEVRIAEAKRKAEEQRRELEFERAAAARARTKARNNDYSR